MDIFISKNKFNEQYDKINDLNNEISGLKN